MTPDDLTRTLWADHTRTYASLSVEARRVVDRAMEEKA